MLIVVECHSCARIQCDNLQAFSGCVCVFIHVYTCVYIERELSCSRKLGKICVYSVVCISVLHYSSSVRL